MRESVTVHGCTDYEIIILPHVFFIVFQFKALLIFLKNTRKCIFENITIERLLLQNFFVDGSNWLLFVFHQNVAYKQWKCFHNDIFFFISDSVVYLDPVGSVWVGWIRIHFMKPWNGSGKHMKINQNFKNITLLFYINHFFG